MIYLCLGTQLLYRAIHKRIYFSLNGEYWNRSAMSPDQFKAYVGVTLVPVV